MFARLAASRATLVVVEFDCDDALLASDARFELATLRHFFDTYTRGVDEYSDDANDSPQLSSDERQSAIDDFLMPVS